MTADGAPTPRDEDDSGDEPAESYEAAYGRYYRPLCSWLRREADRHGLAIGWFSVEDIVQDTFEDALDHWQQIRSPRAWLYAVARRRLLRYLFEAARRCADPLDEATAVVASWRSTVALADAELRMDVERIFRAMRELTSDSQRAAVYAHHVLGYTSQEVAELLSCQPSTARVHTSRGTAFVREQAPLYACIRTADHHPLLSPARPAPPAVVGMRRPWYARWYVLAGGVAIPAAVVLVLLGLWSGLPLMFPVGATVGLAVLGLLGSVVWDYAATRTEARRRRRNR